MQNEAKAKVNIDKQARKNTKVFKEICDQFGAMHLLKILNDTEIRIFLPVYKNYIQYVP